ncbi:hypothetical protein PIB30_073678, partial [Stylosanthes scabra]|nr:hypothetical protein [Stylosanthes scabra]
AGIPTRAVQYGNINRKNKDRWHIVIVLKVSHLAWPNQSGIIRLGGFLHGGINCINVAWMIFGGRHMYPMTSVSSQRSGYDLGRDSLLAVSCTDCVLQPGTHASCGPGGEATMSRSADACGSLKR